MLIFHKTTKKVKKLYLNYKKFAQKIKYYDKNEFSKFKKIDILNQFVKEYNLENNIIASNNTDIVAIDIADFNSYIFITNNDYLTFILPNASNDTLSCMSYGGSYNISLIFEKILLNNHFIQFFMIDKELIEKQELINLVEKNSSELFNYYFVKNSYKVYNNARIFALYIPSKITYLFEIHYVFSDSYSSDDFYDFIDKICIDENNKIKNYFIASYNILQEKINIRKMITYAIGNYDNAFDFIPYYTHYIKIGFLISGKALSEFKKFLNENKIQYILKNNELLFDKNDDELAKKIILEYSKIKDYFNNKKEQIVKLSSKLYSENNKCLLCELGDAKKGNLFCDKGIQIFKNAILSDNNKYDKIIFEALRNSKNTCILENIKIDEYEYEDI